MINDKAEEVIGECFRSLLSRYHIGLETTMKGRDFIFIVLIYYLTNVIK